MIDFDVATFGLILLGVTLGILGAAHPATAQE